MTIPVFILKEFTNFNDIIPLKTLNAIRSQFKKS